MFKKILIKSGETKRILFNIPISELSFYNKDNMEVLEEGRFKISINNLSKEIYIN